MAKKDTDQSLPEEQALDQEPVVEEEVAPSDEATQLDPVEVLRSEFKAEMAEKDKHWQGIAHRSDQLGKELARSRQELSQAQQIAQDAQREVAFQRQQADLSGLDPEEQRVKKLEMQSQATQAELQHLRQERAMASSPIHMRMPREVQMMVINRDIELEDSRIDWALDETDYATAVKRIRSSLKQIETEETAKKEEKTTEVLEEAKERVRAEEGNVPTVKTETPGRAVTSRKFEEIEQAYSEGKVSPADYRQARKEAGIE